jgi:hypothetical protein
MEAVHGFGGGVSSTGVVAGKLRVAPRGKPVDGVGAPQGVQVSLFEALSLAFAPLRSRRPKSRGSEIRLARRPSRTPIGLGRSAPRFGGSGTCIVKVEHQFHFAFLYKWIYFS